MAAHSIPQWRIPWTEEPDVPQSMGSQRVGHDSATQEQQGASPEPGESWEQKDPDRQ